MIKKMSEEILAAWKATPGLMKYVLVIAIVLNASSLASLSENIIKWKGFIKAGIDLYRDITLPVITYVENIFHFTVIQWRLDFIIVYYIVAIADMRTLKAPFTFDKSSALNNVIFVVFAYIWLPLFFLSGYYWLWQYEVLVLLGFILFLHIATPIGMVVAYGVDEGNGVVFSENELVIKRKSILFIVSVVSALLLVCTAAAINQGLRG